MPVFPAGVIRKCPAADNQETLCIYTEPKTV